MLPLPPAVAPPSCRRSSLWIEYLPSCFDCKCGSATSNTFLPSAVTSSRNRTFTGQSSESPTTDSPDWKFSTCVEIPLVRTYSFAIQYRGGWSSLKPEGSETVHRPGQILRHRQCLESIWLGSTLSHSVAIQRTSRRLLETIRQGVWVITTTVTHTSVTEMCMPLAL